MNTSLENLTHKMQRAALGKIVDVALSRAEHDHEKTMCQLVDVAKQFYGSGFSDETYENANRPRQQVDETYQLRAGSDRPPCGAHHCAESGV